MTLVEHESAVEESSGMSAFSSRPPEVLEDLVGDVEAFFADIWGRRPVVMRSRADTSQIMSEEEMWDTLECGLLVRPYFTVFNEGVRSAIADITTTRTVLNRQMSGYANAEAVRADFAAGGTFKLNQPEHWHPRIKALVDGITPHFRAELEAFVFLSPPGKTAMDAHTDGAHVFVVQIAGVKDWQVGLPDASSVSDSRLVGGEIAEERRIDVTLKPGDVLYMPHGSAHVATARDGNSIHLAITIEEPSAENLLELLLARFVASADLTKLEETHHLLGVAARVRAVREALLRHLEHEDYAAIVSEAVRMRRNHL